MKMEKKLYRVKVVLYVMAENESAACIAATRARFDIFECAARKADTVGQDWKDAVPYNADDDRTCGEILSNHYSTTRPLRLPDYLKVNLKAFETDKSYFHIGH
jgi:hypothetical protein